MCLSVGAHMPHMGTVYVLGSEGSLQRLVFFFYHVSPEEKAQIIRFAECFPKVNFNHKHTSFVDKVLNAQG